jgi:hypothetical protein
MSNIERSGGGWGGRAMSEIESWHERADELLAQALDEHRTGQDAIPTATEALAALYRGQNETPETVRLDAAELELSESEPECLCSPDLRARGGFSGRCPIHSAARGR